MNKLELIQKLTGTDNPRMITEREDVIIDKCLDIINNLDEKIQLHNESVDVIFLLSSDGHRDSVNLKQYARNEDELKKLLINDILEFGNVIVEGSIQINHTCDKIYYKYHDMYDEEKYIEDGEYHFFKIKLI
jgi:hypothetical protein